MAYSWLTWAAAVNALAQRLLDPTSVYWSTTELELYLTEALRVWNALTAVFVADFTFDLTSTSPEWLSTATLAGSPRIYTVTDAQLYTLCQYHLLEPPTGAGTWAGTPQFNLGDLTAAFQHRQDEVIQMTACNVKDSQVGTLPNTRRVVLGDTILEVRRAKFIPATGTPLVLWREDPYVFQTLIPNYLQYPQGPREYSVTNQPPLTIDTDYPPNIPGVLDLLTIGSSVPPAPPASVGLSIPDDWSWVLKWGMLADLLGEQSEAQDLLRQQYCLARYIEGVGLMQQLPWVLTAQLYNSSVGIEGVVERDTYDAGWELNGLARPGLIVAGIDTFGICPTVGALSTGYGMGGYGGGGYGGGTVTVSVTLQLVQSAPVNTALPVQVSRDTWDDVLDYCVHLASFKMGGAEFQATIPLFDNFRKSASLTNSRLGKLATFMDVLQAQSGRNQEVDQRFAVVR